MGERGYLCNKIILCTHRPNEPYKSLITGVKTNFMKTTLFKALIIPFLY